MTTAELQLVIHKPFTIPVTILNSSFANNTPYDQLSNLSQTGFSFTPSELLHAIGSKTACLPASNYDACINSAFLYANILDFEGPHIGYKRGLDIDSDLQTNRSNEIGIGIGCLLAHKAFNVDWATLESIRGAGKRFDYRGTNPGQNYAYEFKGTKHRSKQTSQIQNGIAKKTQMHLNNISYEVVLIISTYFSSSDNQPRIVLADPPFEGFEKEFTEEAQLSYSLRHLSRLAQFIGNTRLARNIYNRSKGPAFLTDNNQTLLYDPSVLRIASESVEAPQNRLDKYENLSIGNKTYVGRWISYWRPLNKTTNKDSFQIPDFIDNSKLEIFQGVTGELFDTMSSVSINNNTFNMKFDSEIIKSDENIEFRTFTDGTIMGYRFL